MSFTQDFESSRASYDEDFVPSPEALKEFERVANERRNKTLAEFAYGKKIDIHQMAQKESDLEKQLAECKIKIGKLEEENKKLEKKIKEYRNAFEHMSYRDH